MIGLFVYAALAKMGYSAFGFLLGFVIAGALWFPAFLWPFVRKKA
jgi:hypothetical protein